MFSFLGGYEVKEMNNGGLCKKTQLEYVDGQTHFFDDGNIATHSLDMHVHTTCIFDVSINEKLMG